MYDNKKDQTSAILDSMKGSQRAKPSADLFAKIERKINQPEASVIPLRQLKWAAAAVISLLIINGLAVQQNYKHHKTNATTEGASIISNYTLYDQ